jgi:hypothetical protein
MSTSASVHPDAGLIRPCDRRRTQARAASLWWHWWVPWPPLPPPPDPYPSLSCFIPDIPVRRDFYHSGSPRVPAPREKKPNNLCFDSAVVGRKARGYRLPGLEIPQSHHRSHPELPPSPSEMTPSQKLSMPRQWPIWLFSFHLLVVVAAVGNLLFPV